MKAALNAIVDLIHREPVRALYILGCVLDLGAAFGLHLLPIQTAAIVALAGGLLGETARSQVTPMVNLPTHTAPGP